MAQNFPGPQELRIYYSTTSSPGGTLQHVQKLNINTDNTNYGGGTPFSAISVLDTFGTVASNLETKVENYLILFNNLFETTMSVDTVELWNIAPLSFDGTFVSAYAPTNNVGTIALPTVAAGQLILTNRTAGGGIMKLSLQETIFDPASSQGYPVANADLNAYADYFVSAANMVIGRDNTYPISKMRVFPGQSEALFKKRFRP